MGHSAPLLKHTISRGVCVPMSLTQTHSGQTLKLSLSLKLNASSLDFISTVIAANCFGILLTQHLQVHEAE